MPGSVRPTPLMIAQTLQLNLELKEHAEAVSFFYAAFHDDLKRWFIQRNVKMDAGGPSQIIAIAKLVCAVLMVVCPIVQTLPDTHPPSAT
jgi:hypothetical protein